MVLTSCIVGLEQVNVGSKDVLARSFVSKAARAGINVRRSSPNNVGIAFDETHTRQNLIDVLALFGISAFVLFALARCPSD